MASYRQIFLIHEEEIIMTTRKDLNFLILCGGTGSGKSYIKNMLCGQQGEFNADQRLTFNSPIQVTTRKQREEEPYNSYLFINKETYDELVLNSCLTAKTHFHDNYYGTLKSSLVYGRYAINVIVASKEGAADIANMYETDSFVNIKKALILSDINDEIIEAHHRNKDFVKQEIYDLLADSYDYYIPNYIGKRATLKDVLSIIS
jgi:guanylate kinase